MEPQTSDTLSAAPVRYGISAEFDDEGARARVSPAAGGKRGKRRNALSSSITWFKTAARFNLHTVKGGKAWQKKTKNKKRSNSKPILGRGVWWALYETSATTMPGLLKSSVCETSLRLPPPGEPGHDAAPSRVITQAGAEEFTIGAHSGGSTILWGGSEGGPHGHRTIWDPARSSNI